MSNFDNLSKLFSGAATTKGGVIKFVTTAALASFGLYMLSRKYWNKVIPWVLGTSWFTDVNSQWPGQAFSLKIKKRLYEGESEFQKVSCFETETYGRMLVVDGVIQCTERDEFVYHEMITHIGLHSHPNPKNVLIIGGGDGGTVREVCRHSDVERVDLCELDEMVIRVCQAYLPSISFGFDDPRVRILIENGFTFVRDHPNQYDVIIVDSSDPVGPAEILFSDEFFMYLSRALKADGIAISQAECFWLSAPLIQKLRVYGLRYFAHADYSYFTTPCYPCGMIGIMCCSKKHSCKVPIKEPKSELIEQLKYYNSKMHTSSFVLPKHFEEQMDSVKPALKDIDSKISDDCFCSGLSQ